MKKICFVLFAAIALIAAIPAGPAIAAPCLEVTLTGTMGGPPTFNGLAGAGTLVRYGDDSNDCNDVKLQFDAGRGTNVRLSQLGIMPNQLKAIFFTHIHSDHTDGFGDIMQQRWHFLGAPLDVVCAADAASPAGHTMSCTDLAANIGDAFIASGEIAQRRAENAARNPAGPAALTNVMAFTPGAAPALVWSSGDVTVWAIKSNHIPGHASYQVITPAGTVVIGGDASNDITDPSMRAFSTSEQVELLAANADILVHSTIHPVMGPAGGSGFPPPVFNRQSTATDIGAMAQRAGIKRVMLTHLIPSIGSPSQGPFPVPGGALKKRNYKNAVKDGGYRGRISVGTDLLTVRLPKNKEVRRKHDD